VTAQPSLQDRYFPDMPCFGCGPANERGLRLKSYPRDDGTAVALFTPWPEHDNGMGFLNGGIIATILDCHSAAVVTHEAYSRDWPPLPGAALPYVTAGLEVSYLRPAPLHETVTLTEMVAEVWLEWDEKERARGSAVWKRWRPRG
jgi:acyl-coenzyme A thioesterase PaaI-like protein